MYAILDKGRLIRAPRMLDVADTHVYNPNDAQLRAAGYKPVEYTDPPGEAPEGWEYVPGWEDQGENIVQTWTLQELPPEEATETDYAEALQRLGVTV